ncbi:MAG: hypothetical protein JW776_16050 [Candidatus Lokiarchaeota archaeon]|nr:hypothetical protein [Candidatus Lokiarchaeota archaeon]
MKFLTDEMCGKVLRWLRILGYDTTSPKDHPNEDGITPNDDQIIRICVSTYRILISKDAEIIRKMQEITEKNLKTESNFIQKFHIPEYSRINSGNQFYPCLLLRSDEIGINMAEIYLHFHIELEYGIEIARCPKCNSILQKITKPNVDRDKIPSSVYEYHSDFWQCSNKNCGKYFWIGTHFERITETLKTIKDLYAIKEL